jgi:hypothetical protein
MLQCRKDHEMRHNLVLAQELSMLLQLEAIRWLESTVQEVQYPTCGKVEQSQAQRIICGDRAASPTNIAESRAM